MIILPLDKSISIRLVMSETYNFPVLLSKSIPFGAFRLDTQFKLIILPFVGDIIEINPLLSLSSGFPSTLDT